MKKDIKNSIYSVIAAIATSLFIMIISAFVACKYEDPNSITSISAIIALIGGAFICGLTSSILSHGISATTIISGITYIVLIILTSIIAKHFIMPTMQFGIGKKIILYTISIAITLISSLLAKKKKKKRRSAAALRTNIKRKAY